MKELYIKNMVCDRCVMVVEDILRRNGLEPLSLSLGRGVLAAEPLPEQLEKVEQELAAVGFALLGDKSQRTIESVKHLIIELVRADRVETLSVYLSDCLHTDYSALSRLFSEVEGITIEKYYIEQRIERVKELLRYQELSLSEIALQMQYSSTAYLSAQFKSVTGMTPSQFKANKLSPRRPLDKIS